MFDSMILAPFKIRRKQLHTAQHLMKQVLEDKDLIFFSNHTASRSAFYRFIFDLGLTQCQKDFKKWKELKEEQ